MFIMDGAMIVDAATELISYNKFVVEGLGLDELAEALAARGCLVVYAPGEVCQLEGGEARALRVLVGAAGEVAMPKVSCFVRGNWRWSWSGCVLAPPLPP